MRRAAHNGSKNAAVLLHEIRQLCCLSCISVEAEGHKSHGLKFNLQPRVCSPLSFGHMQWLVVTSPLAVLALVCPGNEVAEGPLLLLPDCTSVHCSQWSSCLTYALMQ